MKSRVTRISNELDEEIKKIMQKNKVGNVEATRRIAQTLKSFYGRKAIMEIRF